MSISPWTAIGLLICLALICLIVWGLRGGGRDMEGY